MTLELHANCWEKDYPSVLNIKYPSPKKATTGNETRLVSMWSLFYFIFIISLSLDCSCFCKHFWCFLFFTNLLCSAFVWILDNGPNWIPKNTLTFEFCSIELKETIKVSWTDNENLLWLKNWETCSYFVWQKQEKILK